MRSHGIYTNSRVRHKRLPLSTVQQKNKLARIFPKCRSGYTIIVLNLAKGAVSVCAETALGILEG